MNTKKFDALEFYIVFIGLLGFVSSVLVYCFPYKHVKKIDSKNKKRKVMTRSEFMRGTMLPDDYSESSDPRNTIVE